MPENLRQCPNERVRVLKSECKRTQIARKTKMFTIPITKETGIIPKIVIFKAYIINQSYYVNSLNLSKI